MAGSDRNLTRQRRGRWIKVARERAGLTTDALAQRLGYKGKQPGGIVSRWESGERAVPSDQFPGLVEAISIPPEWLSSPPKTDLERLEEWLDAAQRDAAGLEREDWRAAPEPDQDAGDEQGGGRGRLTA